MCENINELFGYHIPGEFSLQSGDYKRQKILECFHLGNTEQYFGKVYTDEQIKRLVSQDTERLCTLYKAKLASQMAKSLGRSVIKMHLMERQEIADSGATITTHACTQASILK